jgi:hypothetical protein
MRNPAFALLAMIALAVIGFFAWSNARREQAAVETARELAASKKRVEDVTREIALSPATASRTEPRRRSSFPRGA